MNDIRAMLSIDTVQEPRSDLAIADFSFAPPSSRMLKKEVG
jgi:hypothetical protein